MSYTTIRKLLESRLAAMAPAISTAWENTAFTPVADTAYQSVALLRGEPYTPTMDSFRQEQGVFQVTLFYPLNKGPVMAETRAEQIRVNFPKGLQLTDAGVTVTINGSAHIMTGFRDGDRWAIPVRIPYHSNIS